MTAVDGIVTPSLDTSATHTSLAFLGKRLIHTDVWTPPKSPSSCETKAVRRSRYLQSHSESFCLSKPDAIKSSNTDDNHRPP